MFSVCFSIFIRLFFLVWHWVVNGSFSRNLTNEEEQFWARGPIGALFLVRFDFRFQFLTLSEHALPASINNSSYRYNNIDNSRPLVSPPAPARPRAFAAPADFVLFILFCFLFSSFFLFVCLVVSSTPAKRQGEPRVRRGPRCSDAPLPVGRLRLRPRLPRQQ